MIPAWTKGPTGHRVKTGTREKARGGGKAVSATGEKNEDDQQETARQHPDQITC